MLGYRTSKITIFYLYKLHQIYAKGFHQVDSYWYSSVQMLLIKNVNKLRFFNH
jgi:hypothetical protein